MKLGSYMTALAVLASLAATPALADPGNGKGNGKKHHKKAQSERHHDDRRDGDRRRGHVTYVTNCPPGLAKKDPACIPPGQAKKHAHDHDRDYYRVGDDFRRGDYVVIRDYDRYGLERRDNWDYYRDGDRAYRIDSNTRKVLAVIELIDAFN